MPLPNYTTRVPADKTAQDMMEMLRQAGADAIAVQYASGTISSLTFRIETPLGIIPFRLPVNVDACQRVLRRQRQDREGVTLSQTSWAHAQRVAWRIAKDWLRAQLGLLETEMAKPEQIFLPYMTIGTDKTLYDHMVEGGFKALMPGNPEM